MLSYFFWDIENVSFHNLDKIMKHADDPEICKKLYVVYSKIKEARKVILIENGWIPVQTGEISKTLPIKK